MTGVDPVVLTEYAVIFSVVALPLTYVPILLVANDRAYMGRYGNGRLANVLGARLSRRDHGVALTAIPLMILTNAGPELSGAEFDIGLHVLDHQLLDKDGRRCGNVDDLAIEGGPGEVPEVVALLVGPGHWGPARGLDRATRRLDRRRRKRRDRLERGREGRLGRSPEATTRPRSASVAATTGYGPTSRRSRERTDENALVAPATQVETESGRSLGRCHDLRGELTGSKLRVTGSASAAAAGSRTSACAPTTPTT